MQRALWLCLPAVCLCLMRGAPTCYGQGAPADAKTEIGRYRVYATDTLMVLVDSKTGKLWKLAVDGSGKLKAEGATVEGLAFSNSDLDALASKIGAVNLDAVPEKIKKECKDVLTSAFSYTMDVEKTNKVLHVFREERK